MSDERCPKCGSERKMIVNPPKPPDFYAASFTEWKCGSVLDNMGIEPPHKNTFRQSDRCRATAAERRERILREMLCESRRPIEGRATVQRGPRWNHAEIDAEVGKRLKN